MTESKAATYRRDSARLARAWQHVRDRIVLIEEQLAVVNCPNDRFVLREKLNELRRVLKVMEGESE